MKIFRPKHLVFNDSPAVICFSICLLINVKDYIHIYTCMWLLKTLMVPQGATLATPAHESLGQLAWSAKVTKTLKDSHSMQSKCY